MAIDRIEELRSRDDIVGLDFVFVSEKPGNAVRVLPPERDVECGTNYRCGNSFTDHDLQSIGR